MKRRDFLIQFRQRGVWNQLIHTFTDCLSEVRGANSADLFLFPAERGGSSASTIAERRKFKQ